MYDYRARVRDVLEKVTVLVAPTTRAPAALIGEETVTVAGVSLPIALVMAGLTSPFNVAGTPAMSLPCGFSSGGLPIGMQVVGRPFDEWNVLRVGHAYEQAAEWHTRVPQL
jgi:Asp-tRNA(Asn)/Glu-tRNA(Gln) amidotransferase A subunit family amidase